MKKILFILCILASFAGSAQVRGGKYFQPIAPAYKWQDGWFKNTFAFPITAASTGIDTGSAYFNPIDSSLYVRLGLNWIKQRGTGTGGGSADSSIFATQYRLDTTRNGIRFGLNLKLNISDTANVRPRLYAGTNVTIIGTYPNLTIAASGGGGIPSDTSLSINNRILARYPADTSLSLNNRINTKQGNLTLTTTGSSGASTLIGNTLNIPQYTGGGGGSTSRTDSVGYLPEGSYSEKDANEQAYVWTEISNPALAKWYDGISTAVYKDTVIIFGGWETGASIDSVFHSADGGVTWSFRGLLPYEVHTPAVIHSNDGYTYIIGGDYLNTSDERAKVYRTKDFRTYELKNSNTPFRNRVLHAGVEFNDTLYVGGGQKYTLNIADSVYTDLWKSGDGGVTWALVSNSLTHMGKNISGCFLVFDGRMYIVSGGQYDNTPSNKTWDRAVYSSTDGTNWINTGNIPYLGMQYPNTGVWDGKLWLSGGYQNIAGNVDSTAFMDKSGTWHRYLPTQKPAANHASSMIVYKDKLLRVLGNITNKVWALSRSTNKFFETTPNYSRIAIDTLHEGSNGSGLIFKNDVAVYNNLIFKNSSNTGRNVLRWGTTTFEIWPDSVKKYEFNTSGNFYGTKLLASNSSTSFYSGTYYSTSLQTRENYPGIAWLGASHYFILGLDGSVIGFRQENGAVNGTRMKYDIADGRLVINNTTVNNHDVAFTPSAAVEFGSKIKGFLIPRMNTTERDAISSPANSLMIFNYTANQYQWYDSTNAAWASIGGIGGGGDVTTAQLADSMTAVRNEINAFASIEPDVTFDSLAWRKSNGDLKIKSIGFETSGAVVIEKSLTGNTDSTIRLKATVGNGEITNIMLADAPPHTFVGNNTGLTDAKLNLTISEVRSELGVDTVLTSVYRRSDSVFYKKGTTETFAYKDSVGTGGGGGSITTTDNNLDITSNVLTLKKTPQTLTDGATITYNLNSGYNARVVLGGNRTLSITNPQEGSFGTLVVVQDATGGRRLTVPNGTVLIKPNALDSTTISWHYRNGSFEWYGPAIKGIIFLGSDVANANATANTMADVTDLSFPVVAGYTYQFKFVIEYTAAATTTGSRWAINGPASPTFLGYQSQYSLTATSITTNSGRNTYDSPSAASASSLTASNQATIWGNIRPSANGNVIARFASEITVSAITAKANYSFVEWEIIKD